MLGATVAGATVLAMLGAPASEAALSGDDSRACGRTRAVVRDMTDVSKLQTNGAVTFDGRTIQVAGSDPDYDVWIDDRPTWNAKFRSMAWLYTVADEDSVDEAVDLAVVWSQNVPDPGADADPQVKRETGWTESGVTNRLDTMTCLYDLSGDSRLVPIVDDLVAANVDPARYYGPPRRKPHNHGAMANMALLEAARAFDQPKWQSTALDRLWTDSQLVFDECGMHGEQASGYMLHNYGLWKRATDAFSDAGQAARADATEQMLGRVRTAIAQITDPDGKLIMVGDSHEEVGYEPEPDAGRRLWCADAGWATGRDSWTDPTVFYSLHFGPRMYYHGHDDHGSFTWWTSVDGGAMVFEDPGTPHRDFGAKMVEEASSKAGHSVLEPVGVDYSTKSTARRTVTKDVDKYVVRDSHRGTGTKRKRTIEFDMDQPVMLVQDKASSKQTKTWKQHWRLAPGWTPLRGANAPLAKNANGSYLHVMCRVNDGAWFKPTVVATLRFPVWGEKEKAWDAVCDASGSHVEVTTFAVVSTSRKAPDLPASGQVSIGDLAGSVAAVSGLSVSETLMPANN